jgi:hypothetical protein
LGIARRTLRTKLEDVERLKTRVKRKFEQLEILITVQELLVI